MNKDIFKLNIEKLKEHELVIYKAKDFFIKKYLETKTNLNKEEIERKLKIGWQDIIK